LVATTTRMIASVIASSQVNTAAALIGDVGTDLLPLSGPSYVANAIASRLRHRVTSPGRDSPRQTHRQQGDTKPNGEEHKDRNKSQHVQCRPSCALE